MSLYCIYITSSLQWKNLFKQDSRCSSILAADFDKLHNLDSGVTSNDFNTSRDAFRDHLSELDGVQFPRLGPALIDVADTFAAVILDSNSSRSLRCQLFCKNSCNSNPQLFNMYTINLPNVCHPTLSNNVAEGQMSLPFIFDLQTWLTCLALFCAQRLQEINNISQCSSCQSEIQPTFNFISPPPFWHFEVPADMSHQVLASEKLIIPHQMQTCTYQLAAIIYFGDLHFSIQVIGPDHQIWVHDGCLNAGKPVVNSNASLDSMNSLQTYGTNIAYLYLYKLEI